MKHTLSPLNFTTITRDAFLAEYWQKKPILLKQAMPDFINGLSPEELAGLSLEPEIESRIVIEQPSQSPVWQLKHGPFTEEDYASLPKSHWTLLVQGVDRLLPGVQKLLDYFDFIPQWRVDDVMISYASLHGTVGPHYDNYDVFLLQALGQRKWMLTTRNCHEQNYLNDTNLRIMKQFDIEQEFIVEPGDILYLPPHVGHHGVSLSDDCMTYSFGYRSYQSIEMLNSFCDYVSEHDAFKSLYKDPDWRTIKHTAELPEAAWQQAKQLILSEMGNDALFRQWFGQFATQIDRGAEEQLPEALDGVAEVEFLTLLNLNDYLYRDPLCKMAYQSVANSSAVQLFINGVIWQVDGVCPVLIEIVANQRTIDCQQIKAYLSDSKNSHFVFELWQLQWLQFAESRF